MIFFLFYKRFILITGMLAIKLFRHNWLLFSSELLYNLLYVWLWLSVKKQLKKCKSVQECKSVTLAYIIQFSIHTANVCLHYGLIFNCLNQYNTNFGQQLTLIIAGCHWSFQGATSTGFMGASVHIVEVS